MSLLVSNKPPITMACALNEIRDLVSNVTDPVMKLTIIHDWTVRHIDYATDMQVYGIKQKTVSVEETLKRRLADCEDMAFCIYSFARACQIPASDLKICLCLYRESTAHCVVIHSPSNTVYDCFFGEIRTVERRYDISNIRELSLMSFPEHIGQADPGLRYA